MPSFPEDAACRRHPGPWHWGETPALSSYEPLLAICAGCPVRAACLQDMAETGERYPYQIRAELRCWTDDILMLPAPTTYDHTPAPQAGAGRPRSPLPSGAGPRTGGNINPHVRRVASTPPT
jgi:hypothetical protein